MNIQRDIEPPFTYSTDVLKTLIIIVIIVVVILIINKLFRKKIIEIIHKPNIPHLKNKYVKKLEDLGNRIKNNRVNSRNGYLELSNIVREFVEKVTGIKASSFSKDDASKHGMDYLSSLMEEYYPSEFSLEHDGNLLESIDKSIIMIKNWKN